MIPIDQQRLYRAVQEVNRKFGLTTADDKYKNRLRAGPAIAIAVRMNDMREEGIMWHSALVHACAAQKGIGNSRRALYRKAFALYGWWMRKKLLAQGTPLSRFYGTKRAGGRIAPTCDIKSGQFSFLA